MMRKVHDVVLEEDMPMVNQTYMDMVEQGFAEEIPQNELHPSWRSYYLSTRPLIRKGAASVGLSETLRKRIRTISLAL